MLYKRGFHGFQLVLILGALVFAPWFAHNRMAVANTPVVVPEKELIVSGVELFSLISNLDSEFIYPGIVNSQTQAPDVFIVSIDHLVNIYTFFTKQSPPDQLPLSMLTQIYEGWKPLYIPINENKPEDQLLLSGGIVDDDLAGIICNKISSTGFDPDQHKPGEGFVAFFKGVIPSHYPTEKIVIDRIENKIELWPVMQLESSLNIPAYQWRIWHVVGDKKYLIADWPVVVGKTSTRTRVADLPMDMLEHYPPWTDPETKKHVPPGPGNPLGLWKLKSTHTKRLWYYHGTNNPRVLKNVYRAYSHGCIRNDNDNIRKLGLLLLSHNAGMEQEPNLVDGRMDIPDLPKFRKIPLIKPVLAKNVYDTIEIEVKNPAEESVIAFYPNVYSIKYEDDFYRLTNMEHLKADLAIIGYPIEKIDSERIEEIKKILRYSRKPMLILIKEIIKEEEPVKAAIDQAPQG